jgi:hypothetical protein
MEVKPATTHLCLLLTGRTHCLDPLIIRYIHLLPLCLDLSEDREQTATAAAAAAQRPQKRTLQRMFSDMMATMMPNQQLS